MTQAGRQKERASSDPEDESVTRLRGEDVLKLVHELAVLRSVVDIQSERIVELNQELAQRDAGETSERVPTHRTRSELELQEALVRFRQIAEQIQDAFYIVDAPTGKSLYVSPAFERIFGRPLASHVEESWPRLAWIHPEDRALVEEAAHDLMHGGTFEVTHRIVRPDGSERTVHSSAFLVPGENRITGIVRDVTEELALQEELRHAQRLEALGTLASGVAHDFNNLLMGVGGCIQLALAQLDPQSPTCAYLRRASESILRGAALARQILRFSDKRRVRDGPIVLDRVVAEARPLLASLVGQRVKLHFDAGAPAAQVRADPGDIEQMLMNLASNARDAMPKGGELTFRTAVQGGVVTLTVRDTGVGMNPAVKARIFEPFFTTKEVGKGTGLGLSTVFAAVRRLGGSVSVESHEGRGTAIALSLPLVEAGGEAHEQRAQQHGHVGQAVLIVDDDPLVRVTVESYLSSLGYRTLVAASGPEALDLLAAGRREVVLVIADVMMPMVLGTQLADLLTQSGRDVPVLYMSAHPREELERRVGLDRDAYLLVKPFDAAALDAALRELLAEAEDGERQDSGIETAGDTAGAARIFVIEDNRDVARAMKEMLELDQHEVGIAHGAEQAIAEVPEFRPDVVLCDIELGGELDGFEVARVLRADPRLRGVRFVALTGCDNDDCRERARAAGFETLLSKPLDLEQLDALLLQRRGAAGTSSTLLNRP